ncbi:MAG: hypothetical protein RI883_2043 [Bacteroidota bacterium]|jgi:hypothetical protein
MNKSNVYNKQFLYSLLAVFGLYLGLVNLNVILIDKIVATEIVVGLAIVFVLGILIISPALNKSADEFALKFLLLTTVQMLSIFGIVGVLAFRKVPDFRTIGFNIISVFCILLFVQSFLLVKLNRLNK